ncbi:2'-5'-oligoadenylate synthase-like protein isoform X2 [Halichoerus grypus]
MALTMELYGTPASRLDSFVAQWLQPHREQKEELLEAVWTVQKFLREEHFEGDCGLDQKVRVLKVLKVGSFGNGTALRNSLEVDLVVFLSCFHSFQQEAKHHRAILNLMRKKLWYCQDLLALGLEDVEIVQGVPDALVFTIQTRGTEEPITVTIVPAYRALEPSVSNSQPQPEVYVSVIEAHGYPGNFSPSFSELQRNFVKHRPTKLKSLLRLVKHWYLQNVEALDPRGRTLLHLAVSLGHLESARVLLRHKADVTKENREGWTVLHEAVSTGDPEMVYTVLQHRDYHNTSMALEGVPELLQKILEAPDFYVQMKWEFTSWGKPQNPREPPDGHSACDRTKGNRRVETNQQTPAQQDTVLINQHQQFTQAWWVKAKLIHKRPVMWAVGLDMPGL